MQSMKRDPAPSRWAWRLERLMLTPGVRVVLRVGLPFVIAAGLGTYWLSRPDVQENLTELIADARASIEERPEFMVNDMEIEGAGPELAAAIRTALDVPMPVSSFKLDLEALRMQVVEMDPVETVSMRIKAGGMLQVNVTPRVAVVIWRTPEGLTLLDRTGAVVGPLAARAERKDLPVIAGDQADQAVSQVLDLYRAAQPLGDRLRGFVRSGERRWDVVLDRDQRIMLPEDGAVAALERVIALDAAKDVLSRDISHVDMRLGHRPTIRMQDHAADERRRIREIRTSSE